jgi:uncharacterized protein YbcI
MYNNLSDGILLWVNKPRENTDSLLPARRESARGEATEKDMKTKGEIEAAVCQGISRFEVEYMGRGPKDITAHLVDDLLVVRLRGVLTAAEQHLVQSMPVERGRDLLKDVRVQLIETARARVEALIQDITKVGVLSLHHDISTITGEEVIIFTLRGVPDFREVKRRQPSLTS